MIITKTPLRISFTGGGTDLPAYYKQGYGAVVSAAINKYVYITMNKRFDDTIRISYSKTEIVDSLKEIQHDIAKACMQMAGVDKGVEITSISDIPAGTGLGSSSSFTVGLLNALYSYCGERLSAYDSRLTSSFLWFCHNYIIICCDILVSSNNYFDHNKWAR